MKRRRFCCPATLLLVLVSLSPQSRAQVPPGAPPFAAPQPGESTAPAAMPAAPGIAAAPEKKADEVLYSFKFEGADLDTVMETYCGWTGQMYLKNDSVTASITLRATDLTKQESIEVIESILGMNNIALIPMGEKFVKVVLANTPDIVGHGMDVGLDPEKEYGTSDKLVTQIIQLKNVQIGDVEAAVRHLMHAYGKILTLEQSNSMMITDTEANIGRIREMIDFVDQASATIEPRIYEIKYADAVEIAAKLEQIIAMAMEDQQRAAASRASGTVIRRTTTTTVPRARTTTASAIPAPTQASVTSTQSSANSIIHGKVNVLADERTGLLFIFSQKENFEFFDNIIKVLDVEVNPAITFEVVPLEYADAEELSGTLNELVGAATGAGSSRTATGTSRTTGSMGSTQRSTTPSRAPVSPNASEEAASIENLSRLSEETRILADTRSNSVLLMGRTSDIEALKKVIKNLDVMLEQVVIEAAIFEIGLNDELRHGIDWLYRAAGDEKIGAWDGTSLITNAIQNVAANALSYYQFFPNLDSKMLINISKTDSDSRLISTPVIMTTDNTEATIRIGERRPVVTSTDTYASSIGGQRSNYEYTDIGIELTVTPRINPQRFVVMEIQQKADDVGPIVTIDNNEVPIILNRQFEASIAVPDGGTVVMGGLMTTDVSDTVRKIPILGDIPLIGRYLFSSVSKTEDTKELLVLMTPYVMIDTDEMMKESQRLYEGTSIQQEDWGKRNWSKSELRQTPNDR